MEVGQMELGQMELGGALDRLWQVIQSRRASSAATSAGETPAAAHSTSR